jgi:competence protein ComEC
VKRLSTLLLAITLLLSQTIARAQQTRRPTTAGVLRIYFIDVEGGQSTLIVAPSGQSLLVDAGYAGDGGPKPATANPQHARDPQRILAALQDAGVTALDYLAVTHFHPDHIGGVLELAQLVPIRTFIDHGEPAPDVENVDGSLAAFAQYGAARAKGRHLVPKPGSTLPLGGLETTVVAVGGSTITTPIPGAGTTNAACGAWTIQAANQENTLSVGFHIRFGAFRFVQLGDLAGAPLFSLFCPLDLLGALDVYQLPHHGGADGAANPGALGASHPRVVVMNNGESKGGSAAAFAALRAAGISEAWQLHWAGNPNASNFSDDQIANLDSTTGHWIKIVAHDDGSFVVTNGRTGSSQAYTARSR